MDCARGRDRPGLTRRSDRQVEFAAGGVCRPRDTGAIVLSNYSQHRGVYLAKLGGSGSQY